MPPRCKLKTGQVGGIKPTGCWYKTDNEGRPLKNVPIAHNIEASSLRVEARRIEQEGNNRAQQGGMHNRGRGIDMVNVAKTPLPS